MTERKAAPRNKGAAARSETNGQPKTVEFGDGTLELPAELPATLLFDIAEIEAAGSNPMPVFRLLRSVLGPEQFAEVRNAITDTEKVYETVDDLVSRIFDQYGIAPGE